MSDKHTYAIYDDARVAADADLADTRERVAAHARLVARRLTEQISALPPGYYFEIDERVLAAIDGDAGGAA